MAVWLVVMGVAAAAEGWLVLPLVSKGVEPELGDIVTDLFVQDVQQRVGAASRAAVPPCDQPACAREAMSAHGAGRALYGTLTALGERLVVTVALADADGVVRSDRFSVDRREELDVATARLVDALITGRPIAATAKLGSVTSEEAEPDVRRDGWRGTVLRLHSVHPAAALADGAGFGLDLGIGFEARHFAIEPRFGMRWRPNDPDRVGGYFEMIGDLGAVWLPSSGDVSPLLGGGAGLRYLRAPWVSEQRLGSALVTVQRERNVDDGVGVGLYARAGLMFFRTYDFRLSLHGDYNATFVEIADRPVQHTFTLGLAAHF